MYDIDFGYNDTKESNRLGVERFMAHVQIAIVDCHASRCDMIW